MLSMRSLKRSEGLSLQSTSLIRFLAILLRHSSTGVTCRAFLTMKPLSLSFYNSSSCDIKPEDLAMFLTSISLPICSLNCWFDSIVYLKSSKISPWETYIWYDFKMAMRKISLIVRPLYSAVKLNLDLNLIILYLISVDLNILY